MRLYQLLENTNLSTLTSLWKSNDLGIIVKALEDSAAQEGEDKHGMLAKMIRVGFEKHAESNPTHLFNLLKQIIINCQEIIRSQEGRGYSWSVSWLSLPLLKVISTCVAVALEDKALTMTLLSKVPITLMHSYITAEQRTQLELLSKKHARTKDEEDYDAKNELFVFIGRPSFVESPEGSGNYRKSLEIEQLLKVDGFDAKAHQMVSMMKLRARMQGQDSEVYQIRLPAGTIHSSRTSGENLDDWVVDLINTHKQVVR